MTICETLCDKPFLGVGHFGRMSFSSDDVLEYQDPPEHDWEEVGMAYEPSPSDELPSSSESDAAKGYVDPLSHQIWFDIDQADLVVSSPREFHKPDDAPTSLSERASSATTFEGTISSCVIFSIDTGEMLSAHSDNHDNEIPTHPRAQCSLTRKVERERKCYNEMANTCKVSPFKYRRSHVAGRIRAPFPPLAKDVILFILTKMMERNFAPGLHVTRDDKRRKKQLLQVMDDCPGLLETLKRPEVARLVLLWHDEFYTKKANKSATKQNPQLRRGSRTE